MNNFGSYTIHGYGTSGNFASNEDVVKARDIFKSYFLGSSVAEYALLALIVLVSFFVNKNIKDLQECEGQVGPNSR